MRKNNISVAEFISILELKKKKKKKLNNPHLCLRKKIYLEPNREERVKIISTLKPGSKVLIVTKERLVRSKLGSSVVVKRAFENLVGYNIDYVIVDFSQIKNLSVFREWFNTAVETRFSHESTDLNEVRAFFVVENFAMQDLAMCV